MCPQNHAPGDDFGGGAAFERLSPTQLAPGVDTEMSGERVFRLSSCSALASARIVPVPHAWRTSRPGFLDVASTYCREVGAELPGEPGLVS